MELNWGDSKGKRYFGDFSRQPSCFCQLSRLAFRDADWPETGIFSSIATLRWGSGRNWWGARQWFHQWPPQWNDIRTRRPLVLSSRTVLGLAGTERLCRPIPGRNAGRTYASRGFEDLSSSRWNLRDGGAHRRKPASRVGAWL